MSESCVINCNKIILYIHSTWCALPIKESPYQYIHLINENMKEKEDNSKQFESKKNPVYGRH